MELTFVNVGYGEAIVLRKGDTTILIDGGPARKEAYRAPGTMYLRDYLERKNIRRIELVVVTHLHEDHLCGLLPMLEWAQVGEIRINVLPSGEAAPMLARARAGCAGNLSRTLFYAALEGYDRLRTLADQKGIPLRAWTGDGMALDCGGLTLRPFGMGSARQNEIQNKLEALFSETEEASLFRAFDENDSICNSTSLAVMASDGRGAALLTGDKVSGWEEIAAAHDLHAAVLKATHHGQIDGLPDALLHAAEPQAVVICADRDRTWNSARPELIARAQTFQQQCGYPPCVFVTGMLERGEKPGCALTLTVDPSGALTGTAVETE